MDKPLVSTIIPVKNGERYLAAAIHSVLQQNHAPIQIIVVDGQSTDGTAVIAKSFAGVRYISQQGDLGIAAARNVGIGAAQGEFIAFISADDLWEPTKLSRQVDYLVRHPEIQYTITKVKFFLEAGCSIPPGFRRELLDGDHVGFMPETLAARKSLFDRIGGFNPEFVLGEDNDWFLRTREKKIPMAIIPEVLVHKRIHDGNVSLHSTRAVVFNQDVLRIAKQSIDRKRHQEAE